MGASTPNTPSELARSCSSPTIICRISNGCLLNHMIQSSSLIVPSGFMGFINLLSPSPNPAKSSGPISNFAPMGTLGLRGTCSNSSAAEDIDLNHGRYVHLQFGCLGN